MASIELWNRDICDLEADAIVSPANTSAALARVREAGLTSVAFPALGAGIGGPPLDEAARSIVQTVRDELATPWSIEHVNVALRGAAAYTAFAAAPAAVAAAPTAVAAAPTAGTEDQA